MRSHLGTASGLFTAPARTPACAGLDRLAAQKRAEQAKQGSLLGELRGGDSTAAWSRAACWHETCIVSCVHCWSPVASVVLGWPHADAAAHAAGKRPLMSLGEEEEDGAAAEGEDAGGGAVGASGSGRDRDRDRDRGERHYRGQRMETPSHPGGVSDRAREAAADRDRRQRERGREGVYADTRGDRDRRCARARGRNAPWQTRYCFCCVRCGCLRLCGAWLGYTSGSTALVWLAQQARDACTVCCRGQPTALATLFRTTGWTMPPFWCCAETGSGTGIETGSATETGGGEWQQAEVQVPCGELWQLVGPEARYCWQPQGCSEMAPGLQQSAKLPQ